MYKGKRVDSSEEDDDCSVSPISPRTPRHNSPTQLFPSISLSPLNNVRRMVSFENQVGFKMNQSEKNVTKQCKEPSDLSPYRERSSSIGSIVSVQPTQPPVRKSSLVEKEDGLIALKDNFQLFKKPPVHVSVKEIKQGGLKLLLHSTIPLAYFLYYLMTEYCSENLFFYLIVENYQHHPFSSQIERYYAANKISNDYLSNSPELEINLEDRVKRIVKRALDQQRCTLLSNGKEFDAAKRHVFSLLNSCYYRFRTTSIWSIMESRCNNTKSGHSERSQSFIVNLLLSNTNHTKYCQEISKLVHSFCLVYLPLGYQLLTIPKGSEQMKRRGRFDLLGKKFHIK